MAVQAHYKGYLNALDSVEHTPGHAQRGPFMEFAARDPIAQAKYSAMSGKWEGIESSESAIARGDYNLDFASTTRDDMKAKKPQPKLEMPSGPPASSWNCSIQ
jgi:hypothetical protein